MRFQGQYGTKAGIRHGKVTGQVKHEREGNPIFFVKQGKISRYTVHNRIFAKSKVAGGNIPLNFGQIVPDAFHVSLCGEALQDMEMVAQVMSGLPYLSGSDKEAVIPCLLHGKELVLQPEAVIAV